MKRPRTSGIISAQADLATADHAARAYIESSRSEATKRAYRSDWAGFARWCASQVLEAMPADPITVARYLSAHGGALKPSSLQRKLASISIAHKSAGYASPCSSEIVQSVLRGIRRTHGSAQTKKVPVRVADLRKGLESLGSTPIAIRDRALVLLGYAGGFRRAELAALAASDVQEVPEGLIVTVRRSKTDQEGHGHRKAIPYGSRMETCPVRALRAWREAAGIGGGPLFRRVLKGGRLTGEPITPKAVSIVVKRLAPAMGLDADAVGGHSLRAGLVTDAFAAGVPEAVIMEQTGHRSHQVMAGYRREANLFKQNAAAAVGL